MHRIIFSLIFIPLAAALPVLAISPGDDLLIAGAARTNKWSADLYINNPGTSGVTVEVSWFHRDPHLTNPAPESYSVAADETLILDDVILKEFGYSRASGAIRITAAGGEVTANLIVFTTRASDGATYGSSFEGIPASSATSAGESTTLPGMVLNNDFYTNLFAFAGASGATMDIDLLDPDGDLLDTAQVVLEAYEPWFSAVVNLWGVPSFENGTARVQVSAGSMVMLGSKVDRLSADPTAVEQAFGAGGGSADGSYQFALYDSLDFASGGNLLVEDGDVIDINGTYVNFDKVDNQGEPECPLIFQWGFDFTLANVDDFVSGVEFTDVYPDGGEITWNVTFTIDKNLGFTGLLDAVGENFSGVDVGCNGTFPSLLFEGGKDQ